MGRPKVQSGWIVYLKEIRSGWEGMNLTTPDAFSCSRGRNKVGTWKVAVALDV